MLNAKYLSRNQGFDATTASALEKRRAQVRDVVVDHVDAENARDMDRTLATYAEQCVFDDVPTGKRFRGKAAIAASYQERFEAFPRLERIITRLTVDERSAAVEITMRGEQEGVYRGFPARPGVQELAIVGHFEVDDEGLITCETAYYDQLAAAVALGAMPDLGTSRGRLWLLAAYPPALLRLLRARLSRVHETFARGSRPT
jgi:steroid delta-isomerase-like uncharacterized protein